MALQGSYKVASNAAVVVHAGKSDEMIIRGLKSIALPIGFTASSTTVDVMGERLAQVLPTGGTYDTISCDYNFVIGDPSQTFLIDAALNNTEIQDMRFMVDYNMLCGDFAALDLISDSGGSYRVGTFSSPQGTKNDVFNGTVEFQPAGPSTLFIAHANGTDLTFTSGGTGLSATIASTTQDFLALGFEADMIMYLDHVNGLDPMIVQIESVTANLITLKDGVGDEDSVPDFAGVATTAIHAGKQMQVSGLAELNCG